LKAKRKVWHWWEDAEVQDDRNETIRQIAQFLESLGPKSVISVSETYDKNVRTATVWYWL